MAAGAVVGFSDLPTEALDEIARRVGPLDNVTCAAVSRSWRRALKSTRLGLLGSRLNRPRRISLERYRTSSGVVVSGNRTVRTVLHKEAVNQRTRIIGCSYGWVITVDERECMALLDPLTGRRFTLPPFPSCSRTMKETKEIRTRAGYWLDDNDRVVHKAVLAPGRRLGTYAVMLLHNDGRRLAYLRPGATLWTMLRLPRSLPHKYMDVIFHKGAFCTVTCYTEVNAWVPDGKGGLRARRLTDPRREKVWAALVESASRDDLLMVSCGMGEHPAIPNYYYYYNNLRSRRQYQVSRCDERERRWIPVPAQYIGETAILVGRTCSLCVSTRGAHDVSPGVEVSWSANRFLPYVPRLDLD